MFKVSPLYLGKMFTHFDEHGGTPTGGVDSVGTSDVGGWVALGGAGYP